MKKLPAVLLLVLLVTCLSSCFEIVEEVNLKKDGSGSYSLTMNMSRSKGRIKEVMERDTFRGHKLPRRKDVEAEINETVQILKSVPGISQVEAVKDFTNYIFTIRFNFASIKSLNNAFIKVQDDGRADVVNTFSYSGNHFERNLTFTIPGNNNWRKHLYLINTAQYTCIYHMPGEISRFSHSSSVVSKNKSSLMLKLPVSDVLQGKAKPGNKIDLKP